jgi:hypothetical protein
MPVPALVAPAVSGGAGRAIAEVAAAIALEAALEAALDSAAGYFGPETEDQIDVTPAGTLINNIEFKPVIEVSPSNVNKLHRAADVINQSQSDVAALQTKLEADAVAANAGVGPLLNNATGDQARAIDKALNNGTDVKKVLPADASKIVKGFERKRVDRYYVSAEYNEWRYNIKPSQTTGGPGPSPLDLWVAAGDGTINSGSPTHGEWVDAKELRKAGEHYRRLVRATQCDGAKQLLAAAGTTKAALLASLIAIPANKLIFTDAVNNTPWLTPD